jgi:hypothetical protein
MLALKLYAGRYEVIGGRNAAEILRQLVEEFMTKEGEQTPDKNEYAISI